MLLPIVKIGIVMSFSFFSPARSYRSAIFPAGRTAEGRLDEGPSYPTFSQQERQRHGSTEGSRSC